MADDSSPSTDPVVPGPQRGALQQAIRRRAVLQGTAAIGLLSWLDRHAVRVTPGQVDAAFTDNPDFQIRAVRREDQLHLLFSTFGIGLDTSSAPARLVAVARKRGQLLDGRFIVVSFPPQALKEWALPVSGDLSKATSQQPPYQMVSAGDTRLAFRIADSQLPLAYDTATLLSWNTWQQNVPTVASVNYDYNDATPGDIVAPTDLQTVIEAAYGLYLSGDETTRFTSRPGLVSHPVLNRDDGGQGSVLGRPGAAPPTSSPTAVPLTEAWHVLLRPPGDSVDPTAANLNLQATWTSIAQTYNDGGTQLGAYNYHTAPNQAAGDLPVHQAGPGGASGGSSSANETLQPYQRQDIVTNTSDNSRDGDDRNGDGARDFVPSPLVAKLALLSPVGASFDLRGSWRADLPSQAQLDVAEFEYRSTQGRTHYTKIVAEGYLLPLGHRAALVQVSERRFVPTYDANARPDGGVVAAVVLERFVVLRQRSKTYGASSRGAGDGTAPFVKTSSGADNDDRDLPFRRIDVTTLTTPSVDPTVAAAATPFAPRAFWPVYNTAPPGQNAVYADVQWHCVGTDWEGAQVTWQMPLIFVEASSLVGGRTGVSVDQLAGYYNGSYGTSGAPAVAPASATAVDVNGAQNRRVIPFLGQRVALAQPHGTGQPGETVQELLHVAFAVTAFSSQSQALVQSADQPPWRPTLLASHLDLPAAAAVGGDAGGPGGTGGVGTTPLFQTPAYYVDAFDAAASQAQEMYLTAVQDVPLAFPSTDKLGGLVRPDFAVRSIGRTIGASAAHALANDVRQFVPADYFPPSTDPASLVKLLGGVLLHEIIQDATSEATQLTSSPIFKTVQQYVDQAGNLVDQAKDAKNQALKLAKVTVTFHWAPKLKSDPLGILQPNDTSSLVVDGTFRTDLLHPSQTSATVIGELRNVTVFLIGDGPLHFLSLGIVRLRFAAVSGKKPTLDLKVGSVDFSGVLTLVKQLESYLSPSGSPFAIGQLPTGINVDLSLALPSLQIGIFALSNLAFTFGLQLPFTGEPTRARFAFCSREHPFNLTVAFLGGGGFFAIALGLDGLESLEASLEFGAQLALDLGVASGGVSIVAGIYFKEDKTSGAALSGYVRLNGSLEVLGLITATVEFYLELQYQFASHKAIGRATLTIGVSVLFFSTTVSLSVEKRFGGAGDPSFDQLYPPRSADLNQSDAYNAYCAAFAAVATT